MRKRIVAWLVAVMVGVLALPPAAGATGDGTYPVNYDFLLGAVAAGYPFDASPPGANIWTCHPTAEHPRPVVLVHGTFGNKNTNWRAYAPLLANHGYCVYSLTYGVPAGAPPVIDQLGGVTDISSSAGQLKAFVARVLRASGASQVDILGHSQGTVLPEYYAKFLGGAKYIHNYISLAPLWHGTNVTGGFPQFAAVFGVPEDQVPVCAACAQMTSGSQFIQHLRAGGLVLPGIRYTNIVTEHDELVRPFTSGIEAGMRNLVVQNFCRQDYTEHFEIAADPIAAAIVLNVLDPAHRHPVPCRLVLPFVGPPGG
jgi:triacylglycerol lipase